MGIKQATSSPRLFLSLRWKALIAISLVLLVVDATLALMANRYARAQFELQQVSVHGNQVRQLRGLLARNFEEMTRLVTLMPLLGLGDIASRPGATSGGLGGGPETDVILLNREWGLQSVFWLSPDGQSSLIWPEQAPPLERELVADLIRKKDSVTRMVICDSACLQVLASPILRGGHFAGTLVLGRSLADTLLAFNLLTRAEVAVFAGTEAGTGGKVPSKFPVMTHPSRTEPILHTLAPELESSPASTIALAGSLAPPVLGELSGQWFEVYRVNDLAPGLSALVVDEVTGAYQAIQDSTRHSLLMGLLGLAPLGALLFWLGQLSVGRLRRISLALPLLAESRYSQFRECLPPQGKRLAPADELDQLNNAAQALTDRMEMLQRSREEAEDRLVWLADHDPLTQIYNRRHLAVVFERVLDQARRYGHTVAVLFLDLDRFKDVNESGGHAVGDLMLQRVAEQMGRLVRPSDTLARLGCDEFALVLPESGAREARACAERIQSVISTLQVRDRNNTHQVTVSIGIALFPDHGQDSQELLANADTALFQAKAQGLGHLHCFTLDDQAREQIDTGQSWRAKIAAGLEEDRFVLHFQPIVTTATGIIHHWEVLLRLRDPGGGLAYPDRFMPVAEKTGQILAIDHWVLDRAILCLGKEPRLRLAIHLSGSAMDDNGLLPTIQRLLGRQRVDPTRLIFQMTEDVAISNLVKATELMKAIEGFGCGFVLDDFGSGHASYTYLRRLPVDEIKIDGAFVRDLASNRDDRIFVRSTTEMAHGMGMRVTAKGVGTESVYDILGELGVDFAQGDYLGCPKPEPEPGPWPWARPWDGVAR